MDIIDTLIMKKDAEYYDIPLTAKWMSEMEEFSFWVNKRFNHGGVTLSQSNW